MEESVKIAVRWRPIPENNENKHEIILKKLTKNMVGVNGNTFLFDEVLDGSTQKQVYTDLAKPMVNKAMEGFNFTLLAYGQTGTGKTYTMGFENNEDVERYGITMRAIEDIFSRPNSDKMKVSLSFIEIYNEQAFDLLAEKPTEPLNVKGHKNSLALKKPVKNLSDAQLILVNCMKNRRVRQTKMNPNSSRSHGILTIHIEIQSEERQTKASINLVDLAGSEGVRRTSHKGEALLEGNNINQGLLCIAKVLKALSRKSSVIPYRDTVLTTVLQNSLNLRSYLILLACVTPYQKDCSQTLSTLKFTASAKSMKVTPHLNAIINNYKKSNTPIRIPGNQLKLTPGSLQKTTKELFKSPLPLRLNSNNGCISSKSRQTLSTSKHVWNNQRFSTPATSKSKTNSTKLHRYAPTPGTSNMNDKSKTALNLFPESNTTIISSKDDSFDGFAMNISTSTVIGPGHNNCLSKIDNPRCGKPSGIAFSPIMNRVDQFLTERLGPFISDLQNTINLQQDEIRIPVPTESIRSIAQQMIQRIPKIDPEDNSILNESITPLIAPPSTPVNTKHVNLSEITPTHEKPRPAPNLRRSTRISMRSVRVSGEQKNIEQPQLRKSPRISIMAERAPLAEISVPNVQRKKPKSRISTLHEHFEKMANGSNENAKTSHMDFVLNILNKGTLKDLQMLPMIGSKTAYQIYTHRLTNGAFEKIESLKDMPFWSEKTYQRFIKQNNL